MLRKIFVVLQKDYKTSGRDFMAVYIILAPVIIAIAIVLFTPGLNDTTVQIAMLSGSDGARTEYMELFSKVELFDSAEEAEERVAKRDNIAALIPSDDGYEIVIQGNEPEFVAEYVSLLNALYETGASAEDSGAQLRSFGHTVPPLKTMFVNMLISMTMMLAGMLIAISIVEEKTSNTINAVNVTPLSQTGFVAGKSLFGGLTALTGIIAGLLITGYGDINWIMILLVGISSMILAITVGFVQGLASGDLMEAAANVKMIMLPIAGSIAGYELLSAEWQWTMYWSPFYWAYKANMAVLSKTADWPTVLLCTGMVIALSLGVYLLALPKLRKGLS
ncbi:MAG: ABC transporter permease [Eubacteriales bacterium]